MSREVDELFGYVKVDPSELKVKEYELYRAAYCGLCRSMGKCTGQCSRMSLSYDFAFLALFRLALTGEDKDISFKKRRCLAHPLKKRSVMEHNPQLDHTARTAALLSYHKLADDLKDEKGLKKLRARILIPFAAHARRRVLKKGFSDLDRYISEKLAELSDLEADPPKSVDAPAAIFGDVLAAICAFGLDGTEARIAEQAGRCLGKWIYITDALDDADEDMKRDRFNPFIILYDGSLPTPEAKEDIAIALKNHLFAIENALDLIDSSPASPVMNILRNAIYLGMPAVVEKIISDITTDTTRKDERNLDK